MTYLMKMATLEWLVRHPRRMLHRTLGSVRDRRVRSDFLGLLLRAYGEIFEMSAGLATIQTPNEYQQGYEPTPYHVLPEILRHISSGDVFVDLGCGKGRVLWFVATRRRLKKIVGIEVVPELAQIARQNMAKYRLLTPVTIVEEDVSQADLGDGTVYFLFDPFTEEAEQTLREVLEKIRESLRAHPRTVRILYYTPRLEHILDDASWLQVEKQNGHIRVWKSRT
jgi:precorrin-6B methylase 2